MKETQGIVNESQEMKWTLTHVQVMEDIRQISIEYKI